MLADQSVRRMQVDVGGIHGCGLEHAPAAPWHCPPWQLVPCCGRALLARCEMAFCNPSMPAQRSMAAMVYGALHVSGPHVLALQQRLAENRVPAGTQP